MTADRAPSLQFVGGVGSVTGSKFLITTARARVLVDCGLYQGLRELRERNWHVAVADPSSIDAVVLTHAHVDHCGYLPRLVAEGFHGPVYATATTAALAGIVLPDCGHLHEEEAEYANRKGFSRHDPALPLYTEDDAWRAVELLRPIPFHEERMIADGVSVRLSRAGHILGSATVRMQLGGDGPAVGFSGDLGRPTHPLLVAPDPPPSVDTLLVESTYGNRRHDDAGARGSTRRRCHNDDRAWRLRAHPGVRRRPHRGAAPSPRPAGEGWAASGWCAHLRGQPDGAQRPPCVPRGVTPRRSRHPADPRLAAATRSRYPGCTRSPMSRARRRSTTPARRRSSSRPRGWRQVGGWCITLPTSSPTAATP